MWLVLKTFRTKLEVWSLVFLIEPYRILPLVSVCERPFSCFNRCNMYLAVREGLTCYKRRANQNVLNNFILLLHLWIYLSNIDFDSDLILITCVSFVLRLVSGSGDIKLTKDGNVLLHEMVSLLILTGH